MKIRIVAITAILLAAIWVQAQAPAPPTPPPGRNAGPGMMHQRGGEMRGRGGEMRGPEMGKWWKNPDIAQKLKLTDAQISQLDKTFVEHRLKLIDYQAETEKANLKLQTLLDADDPNEGQVGAQVDQVLAARGKLEREFTMTNLSLRKVLSLEQWRQLKSLRGRGGHGRGMSMHGERRDRRDGPPPAGGPPAPPQGDSPGDH